MNKFGPWKRNAGRVNDFATIGETPNMNAMIMGQQAPTVRGDYGITVCAVDKQHLGIAIGVNPHGMEKREPAVVIGLRLTTPQLDDLIAQLTAARLAQSQGQLFKADVAKRIIDGEEPPYA